MTDSGRPDEAVFAELLAGHGAALRRIARIYGGTGSHEDLHQEICLQIWRSLPSFRGNSAMGTWVYRVALNTAMSWRRGSNRRQQHEAKLAQDPGPISAGTGARAEDAILDEFVSQLGTVDRAVLVLYMEGLTHQEIGEVTGASTSAVAVRLHRIRQSYMNRYIGN